MAKMPLDQIKLWASDFNNQYMCEPTPREAPVYPTHLPGKNILKISMLNKECRKLVDSIFGLKNLLKSYQKVKFIQMLIKPPRLLCGKDQHSLVQNRKNHEI